MKPRQFVNNPVILLTKLYFKEINIYVFNNEYRRKRDCL